METNTKTMFDQTILQENELIWVKPLCDFFGLHVQNQYEKIKKDPILGNLYGKNRTGLPENEIMPTKNHTELPKNENLYGKNRPEFGEIDKNGRILLTKAGFIRWVQMINPKLVREDLREQFKEYQIAVFDWFLEPLNKYQAAVAASKRIEQLRAEIKQQTEIIKTNEPRLLPPGYGRGRGFSTVEQRFVMLHDIPYDPTWSIFKKFLWVMAQKDGFIQIFDVTEIMAARDGMDYNRDKLRHQVTATIQSYKKAGKIVCLVSGSDFNRQYFWGLPAWIDEQGQPVKGRL